MVGALPGALQVWHNYGGRSEVWLYRRLAEFRRYRAHILARPVADMEAAAREMPWPAADLTLLPPLEGAGRALEKVRLKAGRLVAGRPGGAYVRCLERLLDERPFAVVNIHSDATRYWQAARARRLPIVASFYGSDLSRSRPPAAAARLRAVLQAAEAVTVSSRWLRDRAVASGAPPARVHVIPTGIDVRQFPPAGPLVAGRDARGAGPIRLISVTRLVAIKAPSMLPRLAGRLRARGLDFDWTVVGDGPLRKEIEAAAAREDLGDRFHLAGSLPFASVLEHLRRADLMVHAAALQPGGRSEALGMAIVEAEAMALPVVSVRLGGIPEAVRDGETGLLADDGDLEGLVDRIVRIAGDPDLRRRLSRGALEHARSAFDNVRLAAAFESLYDRVTQR